MSDLKILVSHPIQYQVPLYRALTVDGIEVEVGFFHPGASQNVASDPDFGLQFQWDVDVLSGYSHRFFGERSGDYSLGAQVRTAPALIRWASDRHTPLLMMGWFASLAYGVGVLRALRGAPTLILTEMTPLADLRRPKPRWRKGLDGFLLRRSVCMYIGTQNRRYYEAHRVSPDRLFPAPYSVEHERFAHRAAELVPFRPELRRQYGIAPELPTFLFCGKLTALKRPLELLHAYVNAGLSEQASLVYVGDGALRPALESRIQEAGLKHVHLLGFLNQSEMPTAYVIGDVLCLVSEAETWGLVVNEAMACGRPVLVTDTVGCAPDLIDSETGWITPIEALSKALWAAFAQRDHWVQMGVAASHKVSGHTYEVMAEGIKQALVTARSRVPDRSYWMYS